MKNPDGTVTLRTTGKTARPSGGGTPQTKAPLYIGISGASAGGRVRKDRRTPVDRTSAGKTQS